MNDEYIAEVSYDSFCQWWESQDQIIENWRETIVSKCGQPMEYLGVLADKVRYFVTNISNKKVYEMTELVFYLHMDTNYYEYGEG